MYSNDMFGAHEVFSTAGGGLDNDRAYPWLISRFIPAGIKGIVLVALAAAIVSSLASMLNSTATIFTMDIYKPYFNRNASDKTTVFVARIAVVVSLVTACIVAPMLGNIGQAFQYIQEYTGIVTPGIFSIYMLGLFWKKTTNNAAIWGAILSIVFALLFKLGCNYGILAPMPWMRQVEFTFILTVLVIVAISLTEGKGKDHAKAVRISKGLFKTDPVFNLSALAIMLTLTIIYIVFFFFYKTGNY
jgi:SSS family solute:Na+ symporter